MTGYERPSEHTLATGTHVSFWAQVWETGCGFEDEHVRVSPNFGSEADLHVWERPYRRAGLRVLSLRREVDGQSYRDIPLVVAEQLTPGQRIANLERLAGLLAEVKPADGKRKAAA